MSTRRVHRYRRMGCVRFCINTGGNDTGVSVGKHLDSKVVWLKCRVFIDRKETKMTWYTSTGLGQIVVERDCKLSCVGMCVFTCNGTSMEPRSKCCNHESARSMYQVEAIHFTCKTAEPKVPTAIGLGIFAVGTRRLST